MTISILELFVGSIIFTIIYTIIGVRVYRLATKYGCDDIMIMVLWPLFVFGGIVLDVIDWVKEKERKNAER